ncbi:MAG: V-type ATPase 116kDa subunit family protein [Gammaproteobacteria bacterium]
MSLRPVRARWFELLTARDELTLAVETLARTGSVELETQSGTRTRINLQGLQGSMEEFNRLARRYQPYWPKSEVAQDTLPESPDKTLATAMQRILAWEQQAAPLVLHLEALTSEQADLTVLAEMLTALPDESLDFTLLVQAGTALTSRLFVFPAQSRISELPGTLLHIRIGTDAHMFFLAVGPVADIEAFATELAALKGGAMRLPAWLRGTRSDALQQVRQRLEAIAVRTQELRQQIDALAKPAHLPRALSDINRLDWFLTHITSVPVSENFAWVTGWTSEPDDERLSAALEQAQVHSIMHFPAAPGDSNAPMVMHNPWWAQPFEVFARMLGTPAAEEADPSRLLALLVPLLFGYMFGDVGHGLVLVLAGMIFKHRWPLLRILVANGISAMIFGLVFGSVFGREDIIPALWVHPMEHPLPVLLVPLAGGVVVLLLGLGLNAVESWWRGEMKRWWQVEAAVLLLYLASIAAFLVPMSGIIAVIALLWYFTGYMLQSRGSAFAAFLSAAGTLLENIFQLLINTISFVRVGAFALAHAGLSLAFETMARATENMVAIVAILLVGNLIVLTLEGLVVTVQTTRLILFEFFIRFLRGTGRTFRPLAAPPTS